MAAMATRRVSKLGRNIKRYRRLRGLGQHDLAKLSDVSQSTISRLEDGQIQDIMLKGAERLAKALGVTLGEMAA